MTRWATVGLCLVCVWGWVPRTGHAQDEAAPDDLEAEADASAEERIAAIREMTLYARYAEATEAVEQFLARSDLTAQQRNHALEIQAIIHLARRQARDARRVLAELYGRDPDHSLIERDVGPEVRAAFERARDSDPERAPVQMANESPPELEERQSPPVSIRITEGADVVQELRLNFRNTESGPFERILMRFDDTRQVGQTHAPLAPGTDAYVLSYYVEALAPSQVVIATLGSPTEPLTLSVPEQAESTSIQVVRGGRGPGGAPLEDEPSVAEQWWFWTIIVGVLAVGAGVTVGALYGTHTIGPPAPGTLGEVSW